MSIYVYIYLQDIKKQTHELHAIKHKNSRYLRNVGVFYIVLIKR